MHGSVLLTESQLICEYIDDAFASATPQLLPDTPGRRASVRYVCELFRVKLGPGAAGGVHALLGARNPGELERARANHLGAWEAVDAGLKLHTLGDGAGPFVQGSVWSLAETLAAPWVTRMVTLLPVCRGVDSIELVERAGLSYATSWIRGIIEQASVVQTSPGLEDMMRVWENSIPQWDAEQREVDRSSSSFLDNKTKLEGLLGR